MIKNRSVPSSTVIPVLAYDDVAHASAWLCATFGFKERLRIGAHRAQLVFGEGAVILTTRDSEGRGAVLVRGARILQPPTDFPYGERQYTAEDLGGHVWTFSESKADVDPASWGGLLR